jgi:AcrR family transcriptional regulator
MRNQKVDPEDVDQRLFAVFCELGYDGASMELLAEATGLKKASLYHRFPNGKREMAQHVLNIVEQWIQENIVTALSDQQVSREKRLKKAIAAINHLYNGGEKNCLLRALSMGTDAALFKEQVAANFQLIAKGFAALATAYGASPARAQQKAKQVNATLQGALVMSGATGDKSYFKLCLAEIPAILGAAT